VFKDYILTDEITQKGSIEPANISIMIKNMTEFSDYQKYGHTVLLHKQAYMIPSYIKEIIERNTFTNLENLMPIEYLMDIVGNSYNYIENKFSIVKIPRVKKRFIKIIDKELNDVMFNERLVKTTVKAKEMMELIDNELIEDYMQISESKYLVWY